jgi:hypothetical protein
MLIKSGRIVGVPPASMLRGMLRDWKALFQLSWPTVFACENTGFFFPAPPRRSFR